MVCPNSKVTFCERSARRCSFRWQPESMRRKLRHMDVRRLATSFTDSQGATTSSEKVHNPGFNQRLTSIPIAILLICSSDPRNFGKKAVVGYAACFTLIICKDGAASWSGLPEVYESGIELTFPRYVIYSAEERLLKVQHRGIGTNEFPASKLDNKVAGVACRPTFR